MSEIDPKALRRAFGSFMTGVTVVTTADKNGTLVGFTANSFSSVSMEPPLLSVCPGKSLSSFDLFNECEHFHVSILAHDQQAVSNIFASNAEDRFSQVEWQSDNNGCPKITGAIASFACRRYRSIEAGDHIILLGEVLEFESHEKQGLGYGVGGYFSLNMERAATELQTVSHGEHKRLVVGGLVEHQGQLFLISEEEGTLDLPQLEIEDEQPSFEALHEFLEKLLAVPVEIGSVFSVFDHEGQNKSSIYYRALIDADYKPEPEAGKFYKLTDLPEENYASSSMHSILTRYVRERRSGNHSLYVGTDAKGKTHKIQAGS